MLILVKIRNAGELFWDSLDSQERMLLLLTAAYLLAAVAAGMAARSKERRRQEIRDTVRELITDGR